MLAGVERLIDLVGTRTSATGDVSAAQVKSAIHAADTHQLSTIPGHFAGTSRDGQTVRMARTLGLPLRYFVAKMFHGPFLVVSDRIDSLFEWCRSEKIGWQFDPVYTRMIPAHYLVEIDQIGCPDPSPRYLRFFDEPVAEGSADIDDAGEAYIRGAYDALTRWLKSVPVGEPVALAFSGGIDSTSVLLMAIQALKDLHRDPKTLRAFTLDLGGGKDAVQAETVVRDLGLEDQWEVIRVPGTKLDLEEAIRVIEDYHPLDVECAAASLVLLRGIRERYPEIKYLLDGDGGDENLKAYPLEDSDLTISSVLRNPLLYQEGWGIDAIKHSLTYTGGLSRAYVRTFAPAKHYGFEAFSPYTDRAAITAALAMPFDKMLGGDADRLTTLKGDVVRAGILDVIGVTMPTPKKRRFQDGVQDDTYRQWRVSKAWCRQIFLKQWEGRLREAWDPSGERVSGNDVTLPLPR